MLVSLCFDTYSYKSKRYRDKLRSEIKALEDLVPLDRSSVYRKLDSQTVFRLVIAFFRTKLYLRGLYIKLINQDKTLSQRFVFYTIINIYELKHHF